MSDLGEDLVLLYKGSTIHTLDKRLVSTNHPTAQADDSFRV